MQHNNYLKIQKTKSMKKANLFLACLALGLIVLDSCKKEDSDFIPQSSAGDHASLSRQGDNSVGAVYILDNAVTGNQVIVYSRASDGSLTSAGSYPTGGNGTGSGLGSQGSVVLSEDHDYLFAVNAGSNDVSVFSVNGTQLTSLDKVSSGGMRPISVTAHENLVYVLNAGGTGNISGFTIGADGHLTHIAGSDKPLSSGAAGPAQVQFNPSGTQLVVTEKSTNMIDTYSIDANGSPGNVVAHPSSGATPFGFDFGKNDQLIVSDAFGGAPGASAVTSYVLSGSGNLNLVTGPVATNQTAACWLVVTNNGKYCYTTNTGSASVSGYSIDDSGALTLLNAGGVTGATGASPIDMALSRNSKYLYTLNTTGHSISMFHVNNDGSLSNVGTATGLLPGSVGIAAQ